MEEASPCNKGDIRIMAQKLNQSPKIWKLVTDLGIKPSDNPVSDILSFCEKKVKRYLKDFSDCETLYDFLDWVAAQLGTSFEEVHSDDDLNQIKLKYVQMGEKIFASLETWLSSDVCGITIKRSNSELWEGQYVSIIDCREMKAKKAYYTKWHELAHLLILTDQMRLSFKRTLHMPDKDPEEALVDIIAGKFGFYQPLIHPHICNEISFDEIEKLRYSLCPDASYQSSFIGFVKAWVQPCIMVLCQPALKRSQQKQLIQQRFGFDDLPIPELRAVKVTSNEAAKEIRLSIHENMRVPKRSVIHSVHNCETDYGEAEEDLSWWETSNGTVLTKRRVLVKARRLWDDVYALIIPK